MLTIEFSLTGLDALKIKIAFTLFFF